MALLVLAGKTVAEQKTVRVATREMPPFSFQDESGNWQGLTIELWETLAANLGVEYTITRAETISEMLTGIQNGLYDVGVAGTTITAEREKVIDFTQPYLSSYLGIARHSADTPSPWQTVLRRIFSFDFMRIVLFLFVLLLVFGFAVWLFERKANPDFSSNKGEGIGSGFWWAAVTMTTVGYGDKAPKTLGGRTVALLWMFGSIITVSLFTASIVSFLTEGILGARHDSLDSITGIFGTVENSTSADFLKANHIPYQGRDAVADLISDFKEKHLDIIVYDLPVLQYYRKQMRLNADIIPLEAYQQNYGLVMPINAPFRNDLNVALLKYTRSADWKNICARYIGATER